MRGRREATVGTGIMQSMRAATPSTEGVSVIEHGGRRYAHVIRASARVPISTFFSEPGESLQFGLLAHEAGFVEAPHTHPAIERRIHDLQQLVVVQRGRLEVIFHSDSGARLSSVELGPGDAIVIMQGVHSVRVIEDMQCVSVKQGPFLGAEKDKTPLGAQA